LTTANETNGKDRFALKLALANIHRPADIYSPTGVYMSFEHYEVERRSHLKCISGTEGRRSHHVQLSSNYQGYREGL